MEDNFVFEETYFTPHDITVHKTRELINNKTTYRTVEISLSDPKIDAYLLIPILKYVYKNMSRSVKPVFRTYEDFEICFLRGLRVSVYSDIKTEDKFNTYYQNVIDCLNSYSPDIITTNKIKFNGVYV